MNAPAKGLTACVFFVWLFLGTAADAATIEGVTFADRYQAGTTTLTLNNVGLLRYRVIFKGYVAALYLGEGVRPEQVLTDVPKRLELEYFWSIAGPDFGKAAEKILANNFPAAQVTSFRSRLDRLNTLYENVIPGDRYALTYIPGVGTELALNGKPKGIIEGTDFAAAYFAIWLGAKPLDASLKAQLLTPPAPGYQ
jgi:Chalcone isomerase-like